MRLLIIEDDEDCGLSLKQGLEAETFAVDLADTGEQGLTLARLHDYDVILLDMALPDDLQGPEVARAIRHHKPSVPIIVISGQFLDADSKVEMLDVCDDYVTKKPTFSMHELVARIRAVLRRPPAQYEAVLQVGDLTLDPRRFAVTRAGTPIKLTSRLFGLLEVFMRHAGETLSQSTLMELNWDINADRFSRRVETAVQRLRQQIDAPFSHQLLKTIPGRGYQLEGRTTPGLLHDLVKRSTIEAIATLSSPSPANTQYESKSRLPS